MKPLINIRAGDVDAVQIFFLAKTDGHRKDGQVWAGAIDDIRSRVCNNLYLIHVIRYLHSAGPLGCVADGFPESAWKA